MKNLQLFIYCLFITIAINAQEEEFGTGLKFDENLYENVPETVPLITRSFTTLPKYYSLKSYAPTPKSQGKQGSCVGWASAYGARTIANAVKNNWRNNITKINQNTFSPAFVYNQIRVNNKCQGAYIENAMKLMNNQGAAKMIDFPYTDLSCTSNPTNYTYSKAKNHKIINYERLSDLNTSYNLVKNVKKAISSKKPVVIGLFNYNRLVLNSENVWIPNSGTKGHAMVVVGYDDNKAGGAFEVMNSWGNKWGNNGFLWITYADFQRQVKSAFVLVDQDNNNNNNNTFTANNLGGELTLKLSNGNKMPIRLAEGATRNFNIVKASKTTYKVDETYSSGTQFRIYLKTNQKGYVYLVGYGSADKSVNKLYPFANYNDYFSYTNSEIALPNEDYFIEFDNKPGRDILCVLYSKEKLNINDIVSKTKYGSGDFVSKIKEALSNKMFKGSDITFDKNKIAFSTNSNNSSAKVVPIFIEMNHQ